MGVCMERAEFDPRYPAEYQPGGDSLPRASSQPPEADRSGASEAVPEPAGVAVGREVEPADSDQEYLPNVVPVAAGPRPWTARTWVLGVGAGMVTALLGLLCLLPKEASKTDPGGGNYVLMALTFPLTDKVAALGPFIVIAGLAMLLAMFLGGAPRHPQASLRLRVAAALVAVASLVAATFSLFAVTWHPKFLLFMLATHEGATYAYPWIQLTYLATVPLALFGLCAGGGGGNRPYQRRRNEFAVRCTRGRHGRRLARGCRRDILCATDFYPVPGAQHVQPRRRHRSTDAVAGDSRTGGPIPVVGGAGVPAAGRISPADGGARGNSP